MTSAVSPVDPVAPVAPAAPAAPFLDLKDPNFSYFWAANNGDVVFWRVPVELYEKYREQIDDAFQLDCFGEEWGSLWSCGVRTLDFATLKEINAEVT